MSVIETKRKMNKRFEDEVVPPEGSGLEMEQVNLDEGEDYTEELPPMDNDLVRFDHQF